MQIRTIFKIEKQKMTSAILISRLLTLFLMLEFF